MRVYLPFGRRPFPAVVFIHGGGWVVGSVEHSDSECRDLCRACQALVVSVGYRLRA